MGFAHIAAVFQVGLEIQRSETEIKTRFWCYETETKLRLQKTILETCRSLAISTSGVCVLCAATGTAQSCVLNDLQFLNPGV